MELDAARQWIARAQAVCVLTGAGVSAESGVPTFRGPGGLWRQYRPEDLATPEAFAQDPKLVWEWYDWRRQRIAAALPNPGHQALAAWEHRVSRFTLVTQNVDGLHQRAGSRNVVAVHGSIWMLRCAACRKEREDLRVPLPALPPLCPDCGGLLRPGVVWFGENLPAGDWRRAEEAASSCELFLVAGTSALVMPAGGLAARAKQAGARVIEVNAEETPLSAWVHLSFRGLCGEILPELLQV